MDRIPTRRIGYSYTTDTTAIREIDRTTVLFGRIFMLCYVIDRTMTTKVYERNVASPRRA